MSNVDPHLDSTLPLTPSSAVVVIAVFDDGRYLLQHRDPKPFIFYPDHWGFFGGAIDAGETNEGAMWREIEEELNWTRDIGELRYFTSLSFDLDFVGLGTMHRVFYELTDIPVARLNDIALGEGQSVAAFTPREALGSLRIAPYDAYAFWLHSLGRTRLTAR